MKIVMRFLIGVSFLVISACGGSSGGGSDDPETSSNCVLGTSTIGDCTI